MLPLAVYVERGGFRYDIQNGYVVDWITAEKLL